MSAPFGEAGDRSVGETPKSNPQTPDNLQTPSFARRGKQFKIRGNQTESNQFLPRMHTDDGRDGKGFNRKERKEHIKG
jgi:hypothetical protein